jgi:hypothetical protein
LGGHHAGAVDRAGRAFAQYAGSPIGIGLGPYLAYDSKDNGSTRLSGVVSITGSLKLPGSLIARATWHRVATRYDRDTDVFLLGAGYRW